MVYCRKSGLQSSMQVEIELDLRWTVDSVQLGDETYDKAKFFGCSILPSELEGLEFTRNISFFDGAMVEGRNVNLSILLAVFVSLLLHSIKCDDKEM